MGSLMRSSIFPPLGSLCIIAVLMIQALCMGPVDFCHCATAHPDAHQRHHHAQHDNSSLIHMSCVDEDCCHHCGDCDFPKRNPVSLSQASTVSAPVFVPVALVVLPKFILETDRRQGTCLTSRRFLGSRIKPSSLALSRSTILLV